MPETFTPQTWVDGAAGGTPLTAAQMNRVEAGIESMDDRVTALEGGTSAWVSVVAFGAVGNGTADDTAAIQAALNAVPATGGWVQFPAGEFKVTSTLQVKSDNTVVSGVGGGQRVGGSQTGVGTRIIVPTGTTFSGTDIVLVQRAANDRPVHGAIFRDLQIDGGNVAGLTGLHWRSNRSLIHNVFVTQCAVDGIRLHGYNATDVPPNGWDLYDSTLSRLIIGYCGGSAIWFDEGATDMHITPGTVLHDCNKAIYLTGGGSVQITGIHTYDNAVNNIHFNGAGSRTKITGCKIEGAGQHGVLIDSTTAGYSDIQIVNCNLANNGDSATNTYDQIHITGPSGNGITRTNIGHCSFTNKGSNTNLARYGINLNSTAVQTATIIGNAFGPATHFGTGPFRDAGSGGSVRQVRGNGGYITEATGTATVASGSTTVAVTHGLGFTPTVGNIQLTPTNNLGNAAKFWVSAPGATTFTINVNADPGATTATFAWRAASA